MRLSALGRMATAVGLACASIVLAANTAAAQPAGSQCDVFRDDSARTIAELRGGCSEGDFDRLYVVVPSGDMPNGTVPTRGYLRGDPVGPSGPLTDLGNRFWRGRTFYTGPDGGVLNNRLLSDFDRQFSGPDIVGAPGVVRFDNSYADGKRSIVVNYDGPLGFLRDEFREVSPGVFMGYAFARPGAMAPNAVVLTRLILDANNPGR